MSRFQLCINLLLLCLFFRFAPCIYTYRLTGHCKPHKQPQLLQAQQQHTRLFLRVDEEDDFGLGSDDDFDDDFGELDDFDGLDDFDELDDDDDF